MASIEAINFLIEQKVPLNILFPYFIWKPSCSPTDTWAQWLSMII